MRFGTNPFPTGTRAKNGTACPRGRRSPHGAAIPETAPFLPLSGHVRVPSDPRSTLYNTDGQIFSDVGVPCVLFMENYDINRTGYHDTHDTMENIDLDYGAAVCAITIEAVRAGGPLKGRAVVIPASRNGSPGLRGSSTSGDASAHTEWGECLGRRARLVIDLSPGVKQNAPLPRC